MQGFGSMLKDYLEYYKISQTDFAERLGISTKHMNEILNGKTNISEELMLGISLITDIDVNLIFYVETKKRIYEYLNERFNSEKEINKYLNTFCIKEMAKKKWITLKDSSSYTQNAMDLLDYLGIASFDNVSNYLNHKILNKKKGNYITIEFVDVTDTTNREKVTKVFEDELKTILSNYDKSSILVVGLGNAKSTPDSLGPKALEDIIVTRHLFLLGNPEENILKISKIAPGVMADTGIETQDIILSIAKKTKPSLIIVIDALAASTISRINKSIQITDTGIHPGSGIGNMRKEISNDTLGIPVIAIGIPTVVGSSIIVYDTINYLFKHISYIKDNSSKNKLVFNRYNYLDKIKDKNLSTEEKKEVLGLIGELSDTDRISLIEEVLNSLNYNFIVTPKEIDFQIDKLSLVISSGINNIIYDKKSVK